MEMLPIEDIEGAISFEEAKKEIARISKLLSGTTDDTLFILRLQSTRSILDLLERYFNLDALTLPGEHIDKEDPTTEEVLERGYF